MPAFVEVWPRTPQRDLQMHRLVATGGADFMARTGLYLTTGRREAHLFAGWGFCDAHGALVVPALATHVGWTPAPAKDARAAR